MASSWVVAHHTVIDATLIGFKTVVYLPTNSLRATFAVCMICMLEVLCGACEAEWSGRVSSALGTARELADAHWSAFWL